MTDAKTGTQRDAENRLAEAARAGDTQALDALLRLHRATAIRYAMRLCVSPEDAQDAAQEALLALSQYIGALREVAALSGWIFSAVRTHCIRLARRSLRGALHAKPTSTEPDTLQDDALTPEDRFVEDQLRELVVEIIGTLDPIDRELVVRRDLLDESTPEVAAAMNMHVDAMKTRLHRARQLVKTRLLKRLKR